MAMRTFAIVILSILFVQLSLQFLHHIFLIIILIIIVLAIAVSISIAVVIAFIVQFSTRL